MSTTISGTTGIDKVTSPMIHSDGTNEKVGRGTLSGTSLVVTDAFITNSTSVTIIPLTVPTGSISATMASGSFTITSTTSQTLTFVWVAVK